MTKLNAQLLASTAMIALLGWAPATLAQSPQGANVVSGAISIARQGATTVVTQGSNRGVIDWRSFSIGAQEAVRFDQLGRSSVTLNRVTGAEISRIDGNLSANGQIWLSNPNGVMVGPSGQVNVGGLLATTGRIDAADFLSAGRAAIDRIGKDAAVVNGGTITIAAGGYAALAAAAVRNDGAISAHAGSVTLGAGKAMTLDFTGDKLITFQVTQPLDQAPAGADAAIVNGGVIAAQGGSVLLSARAAKGVIDNVVNLKGHVIANNVRVDGGTVTFGDGGAVRVSGLIDASSADAKGGAVTVLGEKVGLMDGAVIDASGAAGGGTVLIGGDWQGKGAIGAAGQNAQIAYVAPTARINVDAGQTGDGGKAVVWADDTTRFSGAISARGGALSGDGGQVETSGKRTLDVASSATVTTAGRAAGKPGAWLLDPTDVTIAVGGGGAITGGIFNPAASSTIDPAVISAALNNGNVTIQTSAGTGGNGDINFVSGAITTASATARTLTLRADRSISIADGTSISLAGAAHNIIFNSGASATSQAAVIGNISIAGRIRIETTGGSISLVGGKGGAFAAQGVDNYTNADGVLVSGGAVLAAGDGSITIRGSGGQFGTNGVCICGGTLGTTGRGAISITGARGNFGLTSNVSVRGSLIQTVDGGISITGTSNIGGWMRQNNGVYLYSSSMITRNGRISITGAGSYAGITRNTKTNTDGVFIQGSTLTATGAGSIILTGVRGAAESYNITVSDSYISTVTGGVTVNGTTSAGGDPLYGRLGVFFNNAMLKTVDGLISISGSGSFDSDFAHGLVINGGAITATGKGSVTLTGVRGAFHSYNISLNGYVATNSGNINVIGTTSTGGGGESNIGVYLGAVLETVNGKISITGAGARSATGTPVIGYNAGVLSSGVIRATGTGSISVTGVRGDGYDSPNIWMMYQTVETVSGAITLDGTATNGGGFRRINGLFLTDSSFGTTSGRITLSGAGPQGTSVSGVSLLGFKTTTKGLTPGSGSLIINGSVEVGYYTNLVSAGVVTVNGSVESNGGSLTVKGSAVTFAGTIGAIAPILSLTTIGAAATTYLGGNVTTIGSQSYGGKVVLNNDITMTSGYSDISVFGTVNSGGTTARSLSVLVGGVDSSAIFAGDIGGVRALKDVLINTNGKGVTLPSLRAANLTVNTHGGFIDQSGTLKISEQASFTAGANYIALNTSGANDFNVLKVSADGDVLVTDGVGGLVLGQSGVGGTLTLSARGTVSQTGALNASGVLMLGASADYLLTDFGNRIASAAANAGSVNLASSGDLTVALVNGTVGITTARNATLTALEGKNLTLNAKVTAGTASLTGNTLSGAGFITAADLTLAAPGGGAVTAKVNGATGAAAAALTKVTAGTVLVNGVPVSAP